VFGDVRRHALDAAARVDLPAGRARLGDLQADAAQGVKMSPMQAVVFGDAARRKIFAQAAGMSGGAPRERRVARAS
jgi:hypothetical protein